MKRRRTLAFGAIAAAAVLAGGWAAWRARAPALAAAEPAHALWSLRLARPGGGELALGSLRGRPLVVNFWATWCAPCVAEMPELDRFHRAHAPRGWQVLGIAIDRDDAVREFLGRIPVGFPIALAGFDGMAALRELGNAAGALPFTLVLDAQGAIRQRKLGETNARELGAWAAAIQADITN